MNNYNDKSFFKHIKKEVQEYSDDITESFPYFCLKIFWDDLSKDDIEDALNGLMTNDEGIDAFFVDNSNKEINIIQCKSCKSEKNKRAAKKDWLSFLSEVPAKLENNNFINNHPNSRLKEIAEEYLLATRKNYQTKLYFFHLGNADANLLKHYENNILYFDWNKIKDEYQEYLSKLDRTEPPSIDIQLQYDLIEPRIGSQHRTLVSIITGDEIVKLRQQYRYKLFDKNLRFGLGKNKINTGIMDTAKEEPDNFYFFNNGITFTSKGFKYRATNSKLTIDYPQIINGAQTVNAIYEAYKEQKNKNSRLYSDIDADENTKKEFKRIRLLFRVIQDVEKDGKKTSPFEEKVIRYNNSQNSIRETDFYANEPEQIKLQEIFAKYGYFYEIKRGDRKYLDSGKEQHNLLKMKKRDFSHWNEKIEIEKLASLWMAYQIDPATDKTRKSNIFGYAQNKYYDAIFESAENVTDELVKGMILAYNLFDLICNQSDIYGKTTKRGQIISKVSQMTKDNFSEKMFENIKTIINGSYLFGKKVKEYFQSESEFFNEKENLVNQVKKYHFFSMGRYSVLAIFRTIIEKCEYKDFLIKDTDTFQNKDFLDNYLVKPWLKNILDELLIKEYDDFEKNIGSSLKTFYSRTSTWEGLQKRLNNLMFEKDKDLNEIFPLDKTSKV